MGIKRICVFCGSSYGRRAKYQEVAAQLGQVFVSRNIGLVYGGSDVGLMSTLANTVHDNGGEVIGIIPKHLVSREVAHKGLEDLRVVNSMHERKALMEELSDAFIAMPGGFGTIEEIFEMVTWAQLELHSKPCGFLNVDGFYDKLFDFIDSLTTEGFVGKGCLHPIQLESSPEKLVERLVSYQSTKINKTNRAIEEKMRLRKKI